MSSWKYAYFFPKKNGYLDFLTPVNFLSKLDFKCDTLIINLEEDHEGHCVEYSTENWDDENIIMVIKDKIISGGSCQVTYKSPMFFFNLTLAQCKKTPYISLAWSDRLFMKTPPSYKSSFLEKINNLARITLSSYVVFLKDSPGFFEERFFFIEDTPCIDTMLSSGFNFKIDSIWVDFKNTLPVLLESKIQSTKQIENDFIEYEY